MAMRRRVKVAVNLASARKPKLEPPDTAPITVKVEPIESSSDIQSNKKEKINSCGPGNITPKTEPLADKVAFKFPPKVEFNRSNSYTGSQSNTDAPNADIDDGVQVMQMDLQKSTNSLQTSPQKLQRQRIKATPVFGQRRNSFLGAMTTSSSNNEDTNEQGHFPHKRERHNSSSHSLATVSNLSQNSATGRMRIDSTPSLRRERHYSGTPNVSSSSFTPTKSTGRIRTESTCSVYSDSHLSTVSKSRKTDDHNSNRLNLRREFEARFSNGVPDKAAIKMADLIYYNPTMNPMEQKPRITEIKAEIQEPEPDNEAIEKDKGAVPVPQLKLNAKGELILDDKSLEIETTAEQEARKVLAKSSLIFLDESTGMNGFYKRHKRTRDWPPEETIRFYRCLQTIGTDFSMMCPLFPKRTRRDIKLKFKKEERCNAALINKAILHPNQFDIQDLKDQFEVEDKEREEEEKEKAAKEQEILARKREYKKIHVKASKSARALKNAEDVYSICEGHLPTEPAKKICPTAKKAPPISQSNRECPTAQEQISNTKLRTTSNKIDKEQDHCVPNLEPVELSIKVKIEQGEQSERATLSAKCPTSSSGNALPTSVPAQRQSNVLVEDQLIIQEVTEQGGQSYSGPVADFDEHSSDEDEGSSRTYVNLDSGRLTEVQPEEIPTAYSEKQSILDTNIPFAKLYGEAAGSLLFEDKFDNTTRKQHFDMNARDNCDIKPNSSRTEPNHSTHALMMQEQPTTSQKARRESFSEINEKAVQKILEDIASGTLQVVSSYDPDTPEDIVTEIYMVDPSTGELCDEPLDLPNELVQSILSVMV